MQKQSDFGTPNQGGQVETFVRSELQRNSLGAEAYRLTQCAVGDSAINGGGSPNLAHKCKRIIPIHLPLRTTAVGHPSLGKTSCIRFTNATHLLTKRENS